MSKYEYRPLPEGSIRLLRIKPNTDQGAPIECEILVYPILDSGRTSLYEGLSYVWGSQDNPRSIRINGCEFPVGGNLYSAISALRDRYLDRVMWVDAICINQADKNEKGHQVQAMARIYAQARGVVVWLGAGTLKTSKAIRAIQRLALLPGDTQKTDRQSGPEDPAGSQNAGSLPKPSVECLGHGEQEAIMHLFHLPWFERVWVLQEVAAARHVLVKAGADEITGDAFCAGLARWLAECAEEPLDPESQLLDSTIHSVTRLMRDTELRPRNDYDTSIPARFSCNIAPLGELIELYRSRKATDDRDKIYALLGMSSDNPAAVGLEPDYNISWAELMQRYTRLYLHLPSEIDVNISEETGLVFIRGRGCVLGQVSAVYRDTQSSDRMDLRIMWVHSAQSDPPSESQSSNGIQQDTLSVPRGPRADQEMDVLCLLHGAQAAIMIKRRDDYSSISRNFVDLDKTVTVPALVLNNIIQLDSLFLVWDWSTERVTYWKQRVTDLGIPKSLQSKLDLEGELNQALRLLHSVPIHFPFIALNNCPTMSDGTTGAGHKENAIPIVTEAIEIYNRALESPGRECETGISCTDLVDKVARELAERTRHTCTMDISPLWLSVSTGNTALARRIMDVGNPMVDGWNELRWAVLVEDEASVRILIDIAKADPWAENEKRESAISDLLTNLTLDWIILEDPASRTTPSSRIMDLFLDAKDSIRDQILHLGVKRSILNWGTLFNFAAKYRLNCDSRDSLGRTLLMNSIYVSDAALAERILVCQRDCTPSCYQGGGWGSKRTSKRYTQCFNQDHSSLCHPCHQRDPTGKTPLMIAATAGCGRIVTVILYFGESLPNAQDSSGLNALMHAANRELEVEEAPDSSAFVYLYNHDRINRDITDEKGRTYLMYAARWGREDIIGAVYDKYNTANAVDERGRTALLYSILEVTKHDKEKVPKDQFNRYLVCLEYILCMKDIDINIVDDDGNSKFSVLQWETVKSGRVPLDQQTMATWETKDMLRFIFEVLQNPLGDKIGARNGSPSNK